MKTLAVAQAPSFPGQIDRNVEQAIALISTAAEAGADIVVLPELFLCGYDPAAIKANPAAHVLKPDDDPCKRLTRASAERRVAVIVGGAIEVDGGVANAALVIAPDGDIIHVYRKAHLWGTEAEAFVAGGGPVLVNLAGTRIGLSICFDAGFPEHMRALALAGADVIACPAAFAVGEERHRYNLYYPVRALENTLYLGVSNAVGLQGGLEMFGESALFSPRGHEIARIQDSVGVAVTAIDSAEIARARADLPYLANLANSPNPLPARINIPVIEWS
ncbi:carbon-nitrogen hydrolase family protein [Rhodoligotrophos defluvii]|uniref:carbon-nitrogen hydrolase family protein n=1 Tax=Rhodoligotrophos defluvii TaxID=2561934 RepID=UPI001484DBAD|nr:carbon-nitrogen hydrolase family protein [Rhodoligotrophos defluvii]